MSDDEGQKYTRENTPDALGALLAIANELHELRVAAVSIDMALTSDSGTTLGESVDGILCKLENDNAVSVGNLLGAIVDGLQR